MADFPEDTTMDSYSEYVISSGHEFLDEDLFQQLLDFSQTSSGFTEVCESVFQNDHKDEASCLPVSEGEDGENNCQLE